MKFNTFKNKLSDFEKSQMPLFEKVGEVALKHESDDVIFLISPKTTEEYSHFHANFSGYLDEKTVKGDKDQRFSILNTNNFNNFTGNYQDDDYKDMRRYINAVLNANDKAYFKRELVVIISNNNEHFSKLKEFLANEYSTLNVHIIDD
jgi:hypothetical protein